MIKVRQSTFETNSSSTHTITIVTEEEYNGWEEGRYLLEYWSDKLVPARQLTEQEKDAAREEYEATRKSYYRSWDELDEYGKNQVYGEYSAKLMGNNKNLLTLKQWEERCADRGMDTSVVSHTTKSGDRIVVFGYGGYDG